jgi:hypothetical protein
MPQELLGAPKRISPNQQGLLQVQLPQEQGKIFLWLVMPQKLQQLQLEDPLT